MDVERINSYSPAELAESSAFVADFYEELDEIDLAILKLKIEGKNLEEIADILTVLGAYDSVMEYHNIKIIKEMRNSINALLSIRNLI